MPRPVVDWYFDPISPFAWLQSERLGEVSAVAEVYCWPVLFAGLLERWGQKGPAEIAPKRRFTYRYACWAASRRGLPFKAPPAHPFNPLRLLRLAVAAGPSPEVARAVCRFVWSDGCSSDDVEAFQALGRSLGITDAQAAVSDPAVKASLLANGARATAGGVFGVPTFLTADGELFWGEDATHMLLDWLAGAPVFRGAEMARADDIPLGIERIPLMR
ncbi:MAG: 2-hydroxychromene-2-carboxylate isomerase [Betaproteobacteria bacterium]|jgi:2-hydroxychromene-2-carboxylate isomerase|nr:DsbA family protein [Rhodocyclaceae bacterium]MCA3135272.1 DsbA family protein [Rhodocyclaceae bacterium]MCA3141678.1 DsbA family protein [Rhodocyclaceae bacterium]MCA3145304.1 DsbA family protein [Rhodocyclaceae bacterium]MCE2896822.1 DsbA family protein [Betaproteobacteria bacterium]